MIYFVWPAVRAAHKYISIRFGGCRHIWWVFTSSRLPFLPYLRLAIRQAIANEDSLHSRVSSRYESRSLGLPFSSRILVVEDDVPVRCLITTTLKTHGYKYLTASNGETAIMMATSHNPDIMLLDLGLPDIDGIEVIRSVRTWSNLPIIVLSARSEDSDKIEALDNGADDYLTKPFSVDELLARLRVTQRRLNLLASDGINSPVFVNGPLKIDFSAGCVWLSENELHLTPIEYKLLCVLAHNVGKVLTHTSLTQKVWGSTQENDIASLRVYMASLRKKLERCPNAPHLIQTHVGVGYRMLRAENDEA